MSKEDITGYSLLELLIAIALVAIIVIAATQLMMTTLGTSGKASGLALVKQSGDHAIQYLERQIRDASGASCTAVTELVLTDSNDKNISYGVYNDGTRNRLGYYDPAITETVFLTAADIDAGTFKCHITQGASGEPIIVMAIFKLNLSPGGKPSERVSELFETKTSLRNY